MHSTGLAIFVPSVSLESTFSAYPTSCWCRSCNREFSAPEHLERHWRDSTRHHYCHVCNKHFNDEIKLEKHALAVHPHSFCAKCALIFHDEDDLHDHCSRSAEHPYYCDECKLDFSSANSYRQHMMSSAHKERDYHCQLGACEESFVSRAALALHWEAGTCKSGIDFVDVYDIVINNDGENHITLRHEERNGELPVRRSDVEFWGISPHFRCTMCPCVLKTAHQMVQHFNSAHVGKVFKCPNRQCDSVAEFSSLGAMLQHIASNSCGGDDNRWIGRKVHQIVNLIRKRY